MRTKKEIESMLETLRDRRQEVEHVLSDAQPNPAKAGMARQLLANVDSEIEALEWSLANRGDIPIATNQLSDIIPN